MFVVRKIMVCSTKPGEWTMERSGEHKGGIACNLLRKGGLSESQVRAQIEAIQAVADLVPIGYETALLASRLRERDTLSYWDSLIVAAALETGCAECWSEDLQAGRMFDERLQIVNPLAGVE